MEEVGETARLRSSIGSRPQRELNLVKARFDQYTKQATRCDLTEPETKWKRQTAVGLELLAEAGNYAAFQRLYGAPPYSCWYPPQSGPSAATPSAADIYYRQAAAAAAATLQKPLPYRLYPPGIGLGMPGPSAHLSNLAASSSLSSLSSYYSQSAEPPPIRSPSPDTPLDPGSPGTAGRRSPSDDEDTIHV
ncbi:homeobox protein B-H1-like [Photinus pyralis]|uniref:homeobox protein B-H1-like n=1 Tax=Photinus pyralis TaxID=7054 RepID=UPI001267072C|nr:homeobox protein B-H1-like [Photinus pyralis]